MSIGRIGNDWVKDFNGSGVGRENGSRRRLGRFFKRGKFWELECVQKGTKSKGIVCLVILCNSALFIRIVS